MIRLTEVRVTEAAEQLVLEVLRSGQLAQGAYVERFEQEFARIHGVEHAIAVNNGTTALIAALQALEIGPGDEVITSPFTFVATLNAILAVGATARFADIADDFNLDTELVDSVAGPATSAVIPVHLYGLVADMDAIAELARANEWRVIEDASQAVGARRGDHVAGALDVGTFSLYATKNVSTGEGGVVTTSDSAIADRLRLLRNQGMRERYVYELAGFNYRMTNVAAAVGIPQLETLGEMTRSRVHNAGRLLEGLSGIEGLKLPVVPDDANHVFHQFTVRFSKSCAVTRDEAADALTELRVQSGIYYPRVVFDYDCYSGHPGVVNDPVPRARRAAQEVLSLPVHQYLSDSDVDRVVVAVRQVCGA